MIDYTHFSNLELHHSNLTDTPLITSVPNTKAFLHLGKSVETVDSWQNNSDQVKTALLNRLSVYDFLKITII